MRGGGIASAAVEREREVPAARGHGVLAPRSAGWRDAAAVWARI